MGVIQQGINQLIGTAAAAARLAPGFELKEAQRAWKKTDKAIINATNAFGNVEGTKPGERRAEFTNAEDAKLFQESGLMEQHLEHIQEGVKLGIISSKNYKESFKGIRGLQKAIDQYNQQQTFEEYLNDLEVSFGGKVGDLPENLQKKIAEQYSDSQRQQFKEGGNK